ncbi:MAG: hypothetical protein RR748_22640 [Pseudomonas sp.]
MTRLKKVWALWPVWLFLLSLIPGVLFWYRWCEWDFQPSWLALAKFVSDFYMPTFTLFSVGAVAYQIWSKWKADQAAFLMEGFRRQCNAMQRSMPGKPLHLYPLAKRREALCEKSFDEALTAFLRRHSSFIYALLAVGYSLKALKKLAPEWSAMLRMELFMAIERDDFAKYEFICIALVSPKGYERVCD